MTTTCSSDWRTARRSPRTTAPTGSSRLRAAAGRAVARSRSAAVTTMVGRAAPLQSGGPVLIYDTTVPAVVADPGSTRPGHTLAAALRAEIVALLGPRQVAFVRPGAHLRADDGNVVRNAVVVTLGDAVIAGHSARVPIAASCGLLCGRGQTLTLERLAGTWTVTGTTGPEWIS